VAKFSREQGAQDRKAPLPYWVIDQMITLSEYAERNGLSAFEAKLNDATETLLEELNEKRKGNRSRRATPPQNDDNIVTFAAMMKAPG
jgi:hypothetical protein